MKHLATAALLAMTLASQPGCTHPRHLTGLAADSTAGSPLRLVVWNQRRLPADIEVTVGDASFYEGVVGISRINPPIVVFKQAYVKPGTYRVVVRDRASGLERTVVFRLDAVANINLMLTPGGLTLFVDWTLHPYYQ